MTLGGIIVLLMLLISLIAFIFFLVKSARTWGVLHSILLSILFIEVWTFLFMSAGVHRERITATYNAWRYRNDAEKAVAETEQLTWGGFDMTETTSAMVPLKGTLRRITAERGRVWRRVSFLQQNGDSYSFDLTAAVESDPNSLADDTAAAAAPVSSESLPANQVLYGFAEVENEDGLPIPTVYLGEFGVTNSQNGAVTVKPTLALHQAQLDYIANGQAEYWTFYELIPLDSHTAFMAADSESSNEQLFGRPDEESLPDLFSSIPEGELRDKLITQYSRDGRTAGPNDPPENIWVRLKINKNSSPIQVDSREQANVTERGFFDQTGRAIDQRLKRSNDEEAGDTVTLNPDMRDVVVTEVAAQQLIDDEVAEVEERFYVRKLNDYEKAFNNNVVRQHEVQEAIKLVQRESSLVEKANNEGQAMITFRQQENQKLTTDLQNYQREVAVLEQELALSTQTLADLKSKMSEMYRDLQARHAKMMEVSM